MADGAGQGRGSNLSVFLEGEGGSRGRGGGAWTRIILMGPRLSPPLLFELLDPQKGYNEYVVSKERNTNRKCIYDNLRV